jgi:hypothetical protein
MHEYPGIIPGGEQMRPEDRDLIDPATGIRIGDDREGRAYWRTSDLTAIPIEFAPEYDLRNRSPHRRSQESDPDHTDEQSELDATHHHRLLLLLS